MKEPNPLFPRFKQKKKPKFPGMSEKNTERMPERKEVIEATHKRSNYRCEAAWIAPEVPCSKQLHCDEKWTRGRSGGVSAYDVSVTQTLCAKCDHCKENEIRVSEILGLFGEQGKSKHFPISEEDYEEAISRFTEAKKRLHIY